MMARYCRMPLEVVNNDAGVVVDTDDGRIWGLGAGG